MLAQERSGRSQVWRRLAAHLLMWRVIALLDVRCTAHLQAHAGAEHVAVIANGVRDGVFVALLGDIGVPSPRPRCGVSEVGNDAVAGKQGELEVAGPAEGVVTALVEEQPGIEGGDRRRKAEL